MQATRWRDVLCVQEPRERRPLAGLERSNLHSVNSRGAEILVAHIRHRIRAKVSAREISQHTLGRSFRRQ